MENTKSSSANVAGAALILIALFVATAAWACTVQARIVTLAPSAGSVGTAVTVRAEGLPPQAPVEARWNGQRGSLLGTGVVDAAGTFLVHVKVPEAGPGIYSIVVAAGEFGLARTAFEVLPSGTSQGENILSPSRAAASSELWTGFGDSSFFADSPQPGQEGFTPALVLGLLLSVSGAGALATSLMLKARLATRRTPVATRRRGTK